MTFKSNLASGFSELRENMFLKKIGIFQFNQVIGSLSLLFLTSTALAVPEISVGGHAIQNGESIFSGSNGCVSTPQKIINSVRLINNLNEISGLALLILNQIFDGDSFRVARAPEELAEKCIRRCETHTCHKFKQQGPTHVHLSPAYQIKQAQALGLPNANLSSEAFDRAFPGHS